MNEKIDVSYFKNQVNLAEDLMYDAKDRAIKSLHELIEENGGSIKFEEPLKIVSTDGQEYLVDEVKISRRGNACIVQEDKVYGFFMFDTPTVIEFCYEIVFSLSR